MDEGSEHINEEPLTQQDAPYSEPVVDTQPQRESGTGHSEFELVLILILLGLLGIAIFVWFISHSPISGGMRFQKEAVEVQIEEKDITNENMIPAEFVDVEGRNSEILGITVNKYAGRHYIHPTTELTLYVLTEGECQSECLDEWSPYTSENPVRNDEILGVAVRNDTRQSQYTLRGMGLYTYNEDIFPGDASGINIESNFELARP